MLWRTFFIALLMIRPLLFAKDRKATPMPDQFEIGGRTFFDIGPPFSYYEIFLVRPTATGSSVQKVVLTPDEGACLFPARIEASSALLRESVASLLDGNPCTIPEKELRRELKRCKHCLVFSGADVAIRVQCASGPRIIRSAVLDRDWFDQHPATPEHTSRTMQLVEKLQHATGPGPLDRPIFLASQKSEDGLPSSPEIDELAAGKFDALFKDAPSTPSEIYRAAQRKPVSEPIQLVSSEPVQPETYTQPIYPQMAQIAHIDGTVGLMLVVGESGEVSNSSCSEGHPILCAAAKGAASKWRFPAGASNREVKATLRFTWRCGQ